MLLLSACNNSKEGNKQLETSKVTDYKIAESKQVPFEVKSFMIENKQLNKAEKLLIEKEIQENTLDLEIDEHVKLQKTINQSFFNTLYLSKIKPTINSKRNCLITASVNFSTDYYSFIIDFEDRSSWHELYLVNYDQKGRMIDLLSITQGDYIESSSHLESNISKDIISRAMYRANYDQEPSEYEVWKEDLFTIDYKGTFQGKNLIFSSQKEDKHISDGSFIGNWKKENSSIPIDPLYFKIQKEDENGRTIRFINEDYFVPEDGSSNVLKGKNNSGDFKLEIVSQNPISISYSDNVKGGNNDQITNERFVKEDLRKSLLLGTWQSTDDENYFVEFTSKLKIENNIGVEDIEEYTLSNTCMNGEGTESKEDHYISGQKSELCWYIISIDEENLSLSFVGRGNTLNYRRIKH